MKVLYAFFAQAAENNPDGTFTAMNADQEGIIAPSLPLLIPQMVLLAKVEIAPEETGKEHVFFLKVADPAGVVAQDPMTTRFAPPLADRPIAMQMIVRMNNIKYPKAGKYKWNLIIDDQELKTLNWNVMTNEPTTD